MGRYVRECCHAFTFTFSKLLFYCCKSNFSSAFLLLFLAGLNYLHAKQLSSLNETAPVN